ncbi:thrombospondin type-1 domain-containing protein 7B isoform X1 [Alosa sapidissima]|uniref:thrombospondin type-1 domain-containing protein 7B isoform X1 n=1 Tax=Alosa sapidissima TaxID=34773 RepID=UPI001C084B09|nr:thrombospondin type-1 domain-containing protein 7B isoform X1 [Alosa sapidissima]
MILKDDTGVVGWTWRVGNYLLLFLSLTIVQVHSDLEFTKDKHYSWKTGQWGRCMGVECGSGGVQTRTVWCVHSEGWTTHHSNCRHGDRPEGQRHCFKVCEWHQDLFEWEVSEWGPCVLVPFLSNELRLRAVSCITAQHGIQRRRVQCVRTSNRTVVTERICDFFSHRPALEQACLIPCPHDCVVSDFSAWSGCSKTCGVGLQHRTRVVLATPMYGGANCPNLTQTRTCSNPVPCPTGENEYEYSLKVGPWSECRPPQHKGLWLSGRTMLDFSVPSGSEKEKNAVKRHIQTALHHHHRHHHNPKAWDLEIGYQTRQVRCTRSDGRNAMLSLCTQDNSPGTFQSCIMPKDCETSDWSPWSPCSKTCRALDLSPGYRFRTRSRIQAPIGGGKECLALEEKEACNIIGDLLPHCPRYVWKSTDWGDCRVAPLLSQQDRRLHNVSILCGGGVQTRETYCIQVPDDFVPLHRKEVSRPVSRKLCAGDLPAAVQPCSIPCPKQCSLSAWSSWGPCVHDNCMEPQGKKGFRQRSRQVLAEAGSESDGCPHLLESMPCEDPVCFQWRVTSEGVCIPTEGACGPGVANQTVVCVSAEGRPVPGELCSDEPPPAQVACEGACAGGCVVGSWSPWSLCSHSCSSKTAEGRQSRTRTILALPGEGGKACPAATALEEWRSCNDHPCIVFYWEASPWEPCVEDPSAGANGTSTSQWNGTASCATAGTQTRTVTCMKMNVGPVIPKRCPDSARPDTVQPCLLPCKTDCRVTPFSEWTACPSTCLPVNASIPTQSRYRTTIQRSANGGQECPDTLYEERECEALPVCPSFRWRTHKWHPCTLVPDAVRQGITGPGEACGKGLEVRGVSCVGEDEEPAAIGDCLLWAGAMPQRFRPCWEPCKDDCAFSAWSKFSECTGCGGLRSRKRSLTGRSRKRPRCQREDLYPLAETEECPCDALLSQPYGNWSSCILPEMATAGSRHGWQARRDAKECGQGLRFRAVACMDQSDHLVSPDLCSESGFVEEVCHIPCPLDCKLSDWSPWSPCSTSCGSGLKVRSKWLREKPFNGGRPCPKLDLKNQAQVYEAVPCHSECSDYVWITEAWSVCTINAVDELPACGEGVQSRKIRCVERGSEGYGTSVNDTLCDAEEMPFRARTCILPCAGECVMSHWGPWSECPTPCDQDTMRKRTRHILRPPASDQTCPEDEQTEPCVLNATCFTYQYNVSNWSTCQLSENAVCGKGTRTRFQDCVRSDGKTVELSVCEERGLENEWELIASCVIDCPISCILSEWSAWTECSHTCGNQGQMVRARSVLQPAHEEGRPCPSQLSQTKPCPIRPCYTWHLGEWSPCRVEGAECGEGLRVRNLSCMVHWGDWLDASSPKPVEDERCGDRLSKESEQELQLPCFVPCPGDCHLTEWSSWSSCQLTCLEGRSFETVGRQARSRAVVIQVLENQESCPHQVFETRPCKGGKCHSYEWRTSGWRDNERSVWCQRSDGVNVTGGCFPQNRPTTVRHCHPPCTKPFSHCTQSGVCGCERGYTEVMTTHGFLDYCTKTPGAVNKKADVKTNSGRLKPGPSQIQDFFGEWSLRPVGPDGRIKLWVYGVTAGGFLLILLIISISFLFCSPPKQTKSTCPPQKPLTLAYDGDVDM